MKLALPPRIGAGFSRVILLSLTSRPNNPAVRGVIDQSVANESQVVDFELRSADPEAKLAGAELEVALKLVNGVSPADVRQLLERVSKYWAESEEFALAVDSVSIKLLAS